MKLLTQIFLAFIIIIKIMIGSIFIYLIEPGTFFIDTNAIASELKKHTESAASHATQQPTPASHGKNKQTGMDRAGTIGKKNDKEAIIDLKFLMKKKAELKAKEEEITKNKAELISIQGEITKKIETLKNLRDEIRAEMAKKKTAQEKKLKHLIKAYSAMKPQKAASLIEKLELGFAIDLLAKMKGDVVGNILSFVDVDKAAKISQGLVKRN